MNNCFARIVACILTFCLLAPAQVAQQEFPAPSIRVSTHYVLVDVVVTDKAGKPIEDLKPADFTVKESGKVQKLASFSLERSGGPLQNAQLPPELYSNRPEYRMPQGPLTVVLLDALNTPVQNQQLARRALLTYLSTQFKPGQQMAVYGLTSRLIKLQDFTSDPNVLMLAIERFKPQTVANAAQPTPAQPATLPSPAATSRAGTFSGGAMQMVVNNLNSFANEQTAVNLETRISETLQAMRELARITGGHTGRKNLIWISAGFPIAFSPDEGATVTSSMVDRGLITSSGVPTPNEGRSGGPSVSDVQQQFLYEIHHTAAMLAEVQTAIYPVDARGLFNTAMVDASHSGLNNAGLLVMGAEYGQNVNSAMGAIASSAENMREIARQTGGQAFISRNDLENAVALAARDGGTYYNLGYASSNKKFDGGYRSLKVEVNRPGVVVKHRAGYFAVDPAGKKGKQQDNEITATVRNIGFDSTMVQFDALVQSATAKDGKAKVPVRLRVEPKSISMGEGDKKQINLELYILAVAEDGKVAVNTGKTFTAAVGSEEIAEMQKRGLLLPADIELAPGKYQIRLAVRDNQTGMLGTLTAPVSVEGK